MTSQPQSTYVGIDTGPNESMSHSNGLTLGVGLGVGLGFFIVFGAAALWIWKCSGRHSYKIPSV